MEFRATCPIRAAENPEACFPPPAASDALDCLLLGEIERAVMRGALLAVGCGDGHFLLHAQEHGWRVAAAGAAQTASAPDGFAQQIDTSLEEGQWPAGSFDAVTLWEALAPPTRPAQLLQRAAHYCRVDGVLGMVFSASALSGWIFPPRGGSFSYSSLQFTLQHFLCRFGFRVEHVLSGAAITDGFTPAMPRPLWTQLLHPRLTLTQAVHTLCHSHRENGPLLVLARYVP